MLHVRRTNTCSIVTSVRRNTRAIVVSYAPWDTRHIMVFVTMHAPVLHPVGVFYTDFHRTRVIVRTIFLRSRTHTFDASIVLCAYQTIVASLVLVPCHSNTFPTYRVTGTDRTETVQVSTVFRCPDAHPVETFGILDTAAACLARHAILAVVKHTTKIFVALATTALVVQTAY